MLVFFFFGRNKYVKNIPERNIVTLFFKCSFHALFSKRKPHHKHWLDKANDRYDQETIDEFKAVYNVGVLFLFYPMYWALFDQQGSRWTIQVKRRCLQNYFIKIFAGHENEWIHFWISNSARSDAGGKSHPYPIFDPSF